MPITVPGLGYAGLGQQTAANALVFRKAMGGVRSTGPRKRRTRAASAVPRKSTRKRTRRSGGLARLRKGSAAAKRHMAKLRRMRKR